MCDSPVSHNAVVSSRVFLGWKSTHRNWKSSIKNILFDASQKLYWNHKTRHYILSFYNIIINLLRKEIFLKSQFVFPWKSRFISAGSPSFENHRRFAAPMIIIQLVYHSHMDAVILVLSDIWYIYMHINISMCNSILLTLT